MQYTYSYFVSGVGGAVDVGDSLYEGYDKGANSRPVARDCRPTKIFIHGMNFSPELIGVGRYTGQLADYLTSQGEAVEVVTAVPHYPGWFVRKPYQSARYYRERINGMQVTRCPLVLHRSGRGLWRLIAPLSFAIAAAPVVLWRILRSRPDVVICIEPTLFSAPIAVFAAILVRARRILYVQDLEIDAAFGVGHLKSGILRRAALAFERFVLRRFNSVVTISERMAQQIVAKGVSANTITLMRNWVDTSRLRPLIGPNPFRRELGIGETDFVVLYSGQIGPKQALHHVLDSAAMCADEPCIQFVVAGEGSAKADLVAQYGELANVHFLPLQPEERLCALLSLADLHVLPQDRGAADLVLPSKLAGMLASGRSILVTTEPETELHNLLSGKAIIVPPGNACALARAIRAANIERPSASIELAELAKTFSSQIVLPAFHRQIVASAAITKSNPG